MGMAPELIIFGLAIINYGLLLSLRGKNIPGDCHFRIVNCTNNGEPI